MSQFTHMCGLPVLHVQPPAPANRRNSRTCVGCQVSELKGAKANLGNPVFEDTLNKSVASGETRSAGARRVGEGFDALPRPSWTSHPPPQTTRVATLDPRRFAKLLIQPQVQD